VQSILQQQLTRQQKTASNNIVNKQDRQALLKAKYCRQVVAVSYRHVWPWPLTLKLNSLAKAVKVHVHASAGSRNTKIIQEKPWVW